MTAALEPAGLDIRLADLPTMASPSASFADDVAHVKELAGEGPVVLVGHSYGGSVIGEAAAELDVTQLLYVASVLLDVGETFFEWILKRDTGGAPLEFGADGTAMVTQWGDPGRDSPEALRIYGANPPRRFAAAAAAASISHAPWRSVPSTFVLATDDRVIHPDTQREVAARAARTVELESTHLVQANRPGEVAELILEIAGR